MLTWLNIEHLASGSCVGSALCSAAERLLMNSFGMCAGGLGNQEKLGFDIYILMMYM